MLPLLWHMLMESSVYLGSADGSSRHTHNLALASRVIYAPEGHLVSWRGVCLWTSSNTIVKYSVVIELLHDAISNGIRYIEILLDSQLVMSQLNGLYHIRDPKLL